MNQDTNNQGKPNQTPTQSPFKNKQYKGNRPLRQRYRNNQGKPKNGDKFEGKSDQLKGKIYYIGSVKQANNFNIVAEIILRHIQKSLDQGAC